MWEGYEIEEGKYDENYLEKINDLINNLGKNGIYTLVDLHQDVLSRITCGEGVPSWYLKNIKTKCSDFTYGLLFYYLGLCKPMSELIEDYDVNEFTPIKKCLKNEFGKYYLTAESMDSFERLYTEGSPLNQAFLKYWDGVSKHFKDNQYVVGYDLINEPIPGNVYKHPLLYPKGDLQFQKLYQQASEVIRKNDTKKIVFYSASQIDLVPVNGGYIFPTSFTETPSKGVYSNSETMVDHLYCN